jgi:hypothetical protein
MATGRLGYADLTAATWTTIYTVPTGYFTVATLNIVNRSNSAITVNVAVSTSTTPANGEYIEFGTEILAHGVLQLTGLVANAGINLLVQSSTANVGAMAFGIETSTS